MLSPCRRVRRLAGLALALSPIVADGQTVVYDNQPAVPTIATSVASFLPNAVAGRFNLTGPATLTGASWWGAMVPQADPFNVGNSVPFYLTFGGSTAGLPNFNTLTFAAFPVDATVVAEPTGLKLGSDWQIYQFQASFSGIAAPGGTDLFFSVIGPTGFNWLAGKSADPAFTTNIAVGSWTALNQSVNFVLTADATVVPEPSTVVLLAGAVPGLAFLARRRRRR